MSGRRAAENAHLPQSEHSAASGAGGLDALAAAFVSSLDEMSYCRLHGAALADCAAAGQRAAPLNSEADGALSDKSSPAAAMGNSPCC